MPIERVEWTCPGCRRKYAIPATAVTPSLCPACQQVGREVEEVDDAVALSDEEASIDEPTFPLVVDTPPPRDFSRRESPVIARKRKRPVLRTIAFCWRLLAGLFALGAVAALLYAIAMAVTMDLGAERSTAIGLGVASFLGSGLAAFGALSFAELIQMLLDIEDQTRSR